MIQHLVAERFHVPVSMTNCIIPVIASVGANCSFRLKLVIHTRDLKQVSDIPTYNNAAKFQLDSRYKCVTVYLQNIRGFYNKADAVLLSTKEADRYYRSDF